jgi:hypothetical protein
MHLRNHRVESAEVLGSGSQKWIPEMTVQPPKRADMIPLDPQRVQHLHASVRSNVRLSYTTHHTNVAHNI